MKLWSILLMVTAAAVVGRILTKKRAVKIALGITASIGCLLVVVGAIFVYETEYKITEIDVATSFDGTHTLTFQEVGEPDWPFGYTHVRLVLKEQTKTVSTCRLDVANDGKRMMPGDWQVTWEDDHVVAVISGEEQGDDEYRLYFDGKTASDPLETVYGKMPEELLPETNTPPAAEEIGVALDEDGYPMNEAYQAQKRELFAIAQVIGGDADVTIDYRLTAKAYPYAIVSQEIDPETGEIRERRLIWNEGFHEPGAYEYVLQEFHYAADGAELSLPQVINFYRIDRDTLEVTDEQRDTW